MADLKNLIPFTGKSKIRQELDSLRTIVKDGWMNLLTSIGDYRRDKSLNNVAQFRSIESEEAEIIYSSDKLARRIIDIVVKAAFNHDYRIEFSNFKHEENENFLKERKKFENKYDIQNLLYEACKWARMHGNSYIIPGVKDGTDDLSEPLDLTRIRNIEYFQLFSPRELNPVTPMYNPKSRNFLKPEFYQFASYGGAVIEDRIHHSRVIRFDGNTLPRWQFIHNRYRHDSVLSPIRELLAAYSLAINAVATMISEYSLGVYKIQGLANALQNDKSVNMILNRIKSLDLSRSIIKSSILDANKEDYEKVGGQYQGVSELVDILRKEIATRIDIPHTILFNEGAGSSGSSLISSGNKGDSERSDWQSIIDSYQRIKIKPPLSRLYEIVLASKGNGLNQYFKNFDNMEISFNSSRKRSLEEEADVVNQIAQADSLYIQDGVLTPYEVRKKRLEKGGTFENLDMKYNVESLTEEQFMKRNKKYSEAMMPEEQFGNEEENSNNNNNQNKKENNNARANQSNNKA